MDDLDGNKIGDVVGWLGFKLNALVDTHLTMLGYPVNHDDGQWMRRLAPQP